MDIKKQILIFLNPYFLLSNIYVENVDQIWRCIDSLNL